MNKHTPGPWWFGISCEPERGAVPFDYKSGNFFDNGAIFGAAGEEVVGCGEYNVFSSAANVRLIAAAPELLEMLRYCREWLQGSSPKAAARIQAIDALIAKTTEDE